MDYECDDLWRIVLDLDETIIYFPADAPKNKNAKSFVEEGNPAFDLGGDAGVILVRPHFHKFLEFIVEMFDEIYIYTAASPEYADEVVKKLFRGVTLGGVRSRDRCHVVMGNDGKSGDVYKILRGWQSPTGANIDSVRTAVVDDRSEVTNKNIYACGRNHFIVQPFRGKTDDKILLKLMDDLSEWKKSLMCLA